MIYYLVATLNIFFNWTAAAAGYMNSIFPSLGQPWIQDTLVMVAYKTPYYLLRLLASDIIYGERIM